MSGGDPACCPGSRADDRRRRRLIAVFAATNTVAYGALIQSFTVLLIPMSQTLGASRTEVTVAATISTLVGAFAAVPVGGLLDRYGGRALMTTGSAIGVGAVLLWSQAQNLGQLYLAFVLVGLALAMSTYEAAFAVLVVAVDTRHRDGAIVAVTMICGLATSFFYFLAGWLDTLIGWRSTLLVLAALLAVVAVPLHLWAVPDRATHLGRVAQGSGEPVGSALRSARFWLLVIAFVAQSGATAAFLLMMVSYFRDVGHAPTTAAAMPIAVGVLQIVSRMALAPLARRFGMTQVTTVSFALQGLGLVAMPLAGASVPLTLLCVAGFGLGYGISVVARPSIVADAFGVARFASILAVMTVPIALSRAGAPLAAAWLADWRFLVLMGVGTLLAAAALVPLCKSAPTEQAILVDSTEATNAPRADRSG
ncbi:MFS transporter [Nocardia higoensis]|uniref:MFS transporter n=1 Tax=Nocardia higoensis TaxID=228599 RepID=UPI0003000F20|nr:MFS transporter [Nocardia higoensis]